MFNAHSHNVCFGMLVDETVIAMLKESLKPRSTATDKRLLESAHLQSAVENFIRKLNGEAELTQRKSTRKRKPPGLLDAQNVSDSSIPLILNVSGGSCIKCGELRAALKEVKNKLRPLLDIQQKLHDVDHKMKQLKKENKKLSIENKRQKAQIVLLEAEPGTDDSDVRDLDCSSCNILRQENTTLNKKLIDLSELNSLIGKNASDFQASLTETIAHIYKPQERTG